MRNYTIKQFNKDILPNCEEFVVIPYATGEMRAGSVVVVSDKVKEVSTFKKRKNSKNTLALILPDDNFAQYGEQIQSHTGILAPYFGIRDLEGDYIKTIDIRR